jgi:nicotinamide mononucleotide transporter
MPVETILLKSIEIIAFGSSVLFTWLAAREKRVAWIWGIVSAVFTGILCIQTGIYSEASLQVYYLWIAVISWLRWSDKLLAGSYILQNMPPKLHLVMLLTGLILMFFLGWFWSHFGAALPYLDAFTTSFSLLAVWLLSRKYLQSWLYWIVIDIVSIYLYLDRELYILAFLFLIYTLLAFYGFYTWRSKMKILSA